MPVYFCLMAIIVGGLILGLPIILMRRRNRAQRWPVTRGVVTRSEVEFRTSQQQGFNTGQSYTPIIEYRYSVNDSQHSGDRYSFAWTYTKGQADAVVERHPVGAEVEVFYNPHDPSESVLDRSTSGVVAPFVFGGLFFLAIGLGGLFLDYPALLESFGFK